MSTGPCGIWPRSVAAGPARPPRAGNRSPRCWRPSPAARPAAAPRPGTARSPTAGPLPQTPPAPGHQPAPGPHGPARRHTRTTHQHGRRNTRRARRRRAGRSAPHPPRPPGSNRPGPPPGRSAHATAERAHCPDAIIPPGRRPARPAAPWPPLHDAQPAGARSRPKPPPPAPPPRARPRRSPACPPLPDSPTARSPRFTEISRTAAPKPLTDPVRDRPAKTDTRRGRAADDCCDWASSAACVRRRGVRTADGSQPAPG